MKHFFVLLFMLCSGALSSQWVNLSIPDNNFSANLFCKTNSGKVYAATNNGIYSSTDFGSNWRYISQGLKNDGNVTCMAGNDSILFAGMEQEGLYKTTNSGINWMRVQFDINPNCFLLSLFLKDNTVYAGSTYAVNKSTNNGVSWERVLQPGSYSSFRALNCNNQFVFALGYAGSMSRLYRSPDNGQTWALTNGGTEILLRSEIECCNEKVYLLGPSEHLISTNNGENFVQYSGCTSYYFLSKTEDNITSGGLGNCKIVNSCGTNFIEMTNGLLGLFVYDFVTSGNNYLLATDKGFYKSTNGGTSWTNSNNGIFTHKYTGCGSYGTRVFTSNSLNGKIHYKDQGTNWMTTYGSKGMDGPHKYAYNFNSMFAFSEDLILNTLFSDLQNWHETNIPLLSAKLFDAYEGKIIASNADKIIYLSSNNGTNWTVMTSNGLPSRISTIRNLLFAQDYSILLGVMMSGGSYELYRFGNGASSWSKIDVSYLPGFKPDLIKNLKGNLYAATASDVYLSLNNGLNWTSCSIGLPYDTVTDFASADNKYYCSTKNNGVFVYAGTSGSWIPYNIGLGNMKVNALTGYFANLYAATDSGFYYADVYSSIENENSILTNFALSQNYPNPFNPSTVIRFELPNVSNIMLIVYDIQGREVQTIVNERLNTGTYEVTFNGSNLSSGVYLYSMFTDNKLAGTKRFVIIK